MNKHKRKRELKRATRKGKGKSAIKRRQKDGTWSYDTPATVPSLLIRLKQIEKETKP